jgi:hypothetical protein
MKRMTEDSFWSRFPLPSRELRTGDADRSSRFLLNRVIAVVDSFLFLANKRSAVMGYMFYLRPSVLDSATLGLTYARNIDHNPVHILFCFLYNVRLNSRVTGMYLYVYVIFIRMLEEMRDAQRPSSTYCTYIP